MKFLFRKIVPLIILGIFLSLPSLSLPEPTFKTEKYFNPKTKKYTVVVAGEILVKFRPTISASAVNALNTQNNVRVVRAFPGRIMQLAAISGEAEPTVTQLLEYYKNDPSVEFAEPNFIQKAFATVPNDPYFSLQWGYTNIKATSGWDNTQGLSTESIAIIDSGIDYNHPDLTANLWMNPIESIPANRNNGIDDDLNGYIDDWRGWNYVSGNNDASDQFGHGTHVAGIAAAVTNNAVGVAGTSWKSRIMTLRVLDASGLGSVANVNTAIHYAADNGAKVINMSLGGSDYSEAQNQACAYAYGKGCVLVAAAGNLGNNSLSYPGSYDNVLSIASVTRTDGHASYSNYNAYVDLCAPGGVITNAYDPNGIYSTMPTYTVTMNGSPYSCPLNYTYMQGTSMATPFVAGLASLIFSQNRSMTNVQVENKMIDTADDLSGIGRNDYFGYGRINLQAALIDQTSPEVTILAPTAGTSWKGGTAKNITWIATDEGVGIPDNGISIYYSTNNGAAFSTIVEGISNSGTYAWTTPALDNSTMKIKIKAVDKNNNTGEVTTGAFSLRITPPVSPTFNTIKSPTCANPFLVTGTKSTDTALILFNSSSTGVTYPTTTSWSYLAPVSAGVNTMEIIAEDAAGNQSSAVRASVTVQELYYSFPSPGVSLTFPVGSTNSTPTPTAAAYSSAEALRPYPPARKLLGNGVNISGDVTVFQSPVTVTMPLPTGAINPIVYSWDAGSSTWSNSGVITTTKTSSTINFTTTHFSVFALFDVSGVLNDIMVYPNPLKLGTTTGEVFDGLSGNERISIYTISGELVNSVKVNGSSSWTWNGTNLSGNVVTRGIYLYLIVNNLEAKRVGKIAVIDQ